MKCLDLCNNSREYKVGNSLKTRLCLFVKALQGAKRLLLRPTVSKAHSKWLVSDAMWEKIKLLIPSDDCYPIHSKGRPQISDYALMNGIFIVLRTGSILARKR